MRTKFSGILTLLLAFVVQLTFAQEKTISGTVSDNDGLPLPGVNIIVDGTSNGTQSDFDGIYTIQASVGQTLVYSYVGFTTVKKAVDANTSTISVKMQEEADILTEVIITAQGIKKEKKALGYSVSSIKEEVIKENPETDLTRVLSGKTAGIEVTAQNGLSGSSNKIIIRGMNSFSGNQNALYIIDGIPFSNDTNEAGDFTDGNMGSSRSFDLDPNNIERVEILKGYAATTLYGSEGSNGVILVTTKTGNSKNTNTKQEVQVTASTFINQVGALPDYQNKYGGGFDQAFGWFYSNWGPGFQEEGLGGWGNDPAYDEDGTLPHPYSTSDYLGTNYPEYQALFEGQRYDWKPRTSVEDFFRKGVVTNLSVSARGRSEDGKFGYGVAYSNLNEDGFTPGNNVKRNNLTISGDAKLTNKIHLRGSMTFTNSKLKTPPVSTSFGSSTGGLGSSIFGDLFYTPRSIDFFELPYSLPDGGSVYYRQDNAIQHPLWTLNNAFFTQKTNRVNGFAAIDYDITEHFNILYQGSVDVYSENTTNKQNTGGVSDFVEIQRGFYNTWNTTNSIYDHKVIFSGNDFKFLNDNFTLDFNLGATSRGTTYDQFGINSNDQQTFGFFDHSGFANHTQREYHSRVNVVGVFGQIYLDFKNFLYLNVSGRKDWISNIIDNSQFYPSASLSFVPTSAFEGLKSSDAINFMKLRAGYGTSAGFPTGYPTSTNLTLNSTAWVDDGGGFITTNTTDDFLANPAQKPELYEELEFGIETKLFHRITLDASYYERTSTDLIVQGVPIPASTGYTSTDKNLGEVESWGFEADLGVDILKNTEGFNWNFNVNFNKFDSEVLKVSDELDFQMYAGYTNLGNGARVGYPLGAMFGARVARDENGNLLVNSAGSYVTESVDEDGLLPFIGDPNPDYTMNFRNSFSWKGLSLGVGISHVSGGDIYSVTVATLMGRGLTTDTEDRLGTYILPGVSQTTGEANDIQINNSDFYFTNGFASAADELSIYDGSVVRLSEVSLAYALPSKFLDKTPFGALSVKVVGTNLWYDAYNTPDGINFDPNTTGLGAGNGQGFEFMTGPSSKRYGVSINAKF